MLDTLHKLMPTSFPALTRAKLETLQVNLGYRCNQQCQHCHVNAGPKRKEEMSRETIDDVLTFIDKQGIKILDITGGAPEMNPQFNYLVGEASARGLHIMDRCNLTILQEPGYEALAEFLAQHNVEIIASLPCYLEENVDGQRGKGVYQASIEALKKLNTLGYGKADERLPLNLVYNPTGPFLPPSQESLSKDYRQRLDEMHGVVFNQLYTLANMPIARFGSSLLSRGQFDDYMSILRGAYQQDNLNSVMCRSLISVDWQGYLYDCDFNQMLNLPIQIEARTNSSLHIRDCLDVNFENQSIVVMEHCYGCTAGQGSSCGGALSG
ncbi:MAG: arsenosugar biosynthesis radical SAM protein ArsS [Gammaproteobacteria bacterium]|nr:arsenosugar biosynthesis radical SAM protein ArsS [Gammaproteobacteria bacterium]